MAFILIIHYGEPSPFDEGYMASRYGLLARELVARGHELFRILPSFAHVGRTQRRHSEVWLDTQGEGKVFHVGVPSYGQGVSVQRLLFLHRLAKGAAAAAIPGAGHLDLILCGLPPPSLARAARKRAQLEGASLVLDVRDLWPDAQVARLPTFLHGLVRSSLVPVACEMRRLLRSADAVSAISPAYAHWASDRARHDVPHFPIVSQRPLPGCQQQPKFGRWTAVFVGSLTPQFDFDWLLRGWRSLVGSWDARDSPPRLSIAGDGPMRRKLLGLIADDPTIEFHGHLTRRDTYVLMQRAHVGIAPYRRGASMSLPNKIIEYLTTGLPVISTLEGDAADLLRESRAGVSVDACNSESLAQALRNLAADDVRAKYEAAIQILLPELDPTRVTNRFADFVELQLAAQAP